MRFAPVDFLAVGPARTATIWLHHILQGHVNLSVVVKETRFFDLYFSRGISWYRSQFGTVQAGLPIGEVAPTYFHSAAVQQRIKQVAPAAKVVCTFRDPVERLYSLYRYKRFMANFKWDFEQAVSLDPEMAESAVYSKHLSAWIEAFRQSNVLVLLYDDLLRDPQEYIDRICQFLAITKFKLQPSAFSFMNTSEKLQAPRNYRLAHAVIIAIRKMSDLRLSGALAFLTRLKPLLLPQFDGIGTELPPLDPIFASELRNRLIPEIEALERIIGRDLSPWKEPL